MEKLRKALEKRASQSRCYGAEREEGVNFFFAIANTYSESSRLQFIQIDGLLYCLSEVSQVYTHPRQRRKRGVGLEEKEELPQEKGKKPYMKPEFRYERVFEVQALSCMKKPGEMKCGTTANKQS